MTRRWAMSVVAALALAGLPVGTSAYAADPVFPQFDGFPGGAGMGTASDGFINLATSTPGQPPNPTPRSVTAQADPSSLQPAAILRSDLSGTPVASLRLLSLGLDKLDIALPLSTIPPTTTGWADLLAGTPLAGAPLISTTWTDVVTMASRPAAVDALTVGDIDWTSSVLRDLPVAAFTFGGAALTAIDIPPLAGEPATDDPATKWCTLLNSVRAGSCASPDSLVGETLISASLRGAPIKDLPLKSIPLNQADLSASPLKSIPLKSIVAQSAALASVPLKSIDLAASPLKSIPLKSIDLASSPLKSIPLKSIDWQASPLKSIPLKSIDLTASPIGALPLKSIDWSVAPLKSIPLKSIDLAASPLKSIPLKSIVLADAPLKSIPLKSIDFSVAPLKSIPLKSIDLTSSGLAAYPLAAVDWSRAGLGTAPLSGFTTATGPLANIRVVSLADPAAVVTCGSTCPAGATLGSVTAAGQLVSSATLRSIGSSGFASAAITLGDLLTAGTSAAYAPTLGDLRLDLAAATAPSLTLGSLVLALSSTVDPTVADLDPATATVTITLGDLALDRLSTNVETVAGLVASLLAGAPEVTLGDLRLDLATGVGGLLLDVLISHLLGGALDELLLGDIGTYTTDTGHDITLGELGTWRLPGGEITLGDLARYLDSSVSLADVLLGLVPASAFPYENFPFSSLGLGDPGRLAVPYGFDPDPTKPAKPAVLAPAVDTHATIGFVNNAAVETQPVDITLTLSEGTRFSSLTIGSRPVTPAVAVTVAGEPTVTVSGYTLAPGATETFDLAFAPGWRMGLQTLYARVVDPATGTELDSFLFSTAPVIDGQEGRWVDARIPDLPLNPAGCFSTDASCVGKDRVSLDVLASGHIGTAGDRDWFRVRNVRAGTRLTADLTNLPSDADLVLYGPAGITGSPSAFPANAAGLPGATVEDPDLGVGQTAKTLAREGIAGLQLDQGWTDKDTGIWHPALTPLSISQHRGLDNEAVGVVAPVDGDYVVQVTGYNTETSKDPYVLRVRGLTPVADLICSPRTFPHDMGSSAPNPVPPGTNALFLTAPRRLAATYGPDQAASIGSRLEYFVDYLLDNPQLGVVPAIVPVDAYENVSAAYGQWDSTPCSVAAANEVTTSITSVLKSLRSNGVTLSSVTVVGGDDIIPMGRVPDLTRVANQAEYASTFRDTKNPLSAAEAGGFTLTDDPYGDTSPKALGNGSTMFVPQAAVGRLVEGPDEIVAALNTFVAKGGMLESGTALVSGYDFLADGAQATWDRLAAPGRGMESLIDPPGTTPGWSGADLMAKLFPTGADSPLVASLNAHYDHRALLSAAGDASGGTDLVTADAVGTAAGADRLAGRILFTMGCNAGLAVPDAYLAGTTATDVAGDWAQTLAKANVAVYVANTGYGIGDNHSVAYTERLMALYAKLLDGQITAGEAFARAKQAYYGSLGAVGVYDAKILQQSAFYGLPFWQLNPLTTGPAPAARGAVAAAPQAVPGPDPVAGLQSLPVEVTPTFAQVDTANGRYWTADGNDPQVTQFQPLQPRLSLPVTAPDLVAHGALIDSLVSHDVSGVVPVVGAPNVDTTAAAPEVQADDSAWPASIAAITTTSGASGPEQSLVVMPGQFSGSTHDGTGVQRLYDSATVKVLYAAPSATDFTPPTITSSEGKVSGSTMTFTVASADVGGGPVSQVRVGYELGGGQWAFVDLTRDATDATRWSGSAGVHAADTVVPYFVQAVDASGNVAVANAKHNGFIASADTSAPTITATISPAPNAAGWIQGTRATVSFTCSDSGTGLDVSGCPAPVTLSSPGSIVVTRSVRDRAGNSATAVAGVNLDGSAPLMTATVEPSGWSTADSATVTFSCADNGSGLSGPCPSPVTVTAEGVTTVSRTITDLAGNSTTATADVRLDRTAPTITASVAPEPNASGWVRASAATVTFACADAVSGIPENACPGPLSVPEGVTDTGAGVADAAGNTAYASVKVSVDGTAPVVQFTGTAPNLACQTTDVLSGVAAPATLSSAPVASGVTSYTCAGARDVAGNTAAPISQTVTQSIVFSGFARPITAPPSVNTVKKGSTVKLSFGLTLNGAPLSNLSAVSATDVRSVSCGPWAQTAGAWKAAIGKLTVARRTSTYTYAWTTPRTAGCYEYRLTLSDGSTRHAWFRLN